MSNVDNASSSLLAWRRRSLLTDIFLWGCPLRGLTGQPVMRVLESITESSLFTAPGVALNLRKAVI